MIVTTKWWITAPGQTMHLASGVVHTERIAAGSAGERLRKNADDTAAQAAATAAEARGLDPVAACWLRRVNGKTCYGVQARAAQHAQKWRKSDIARR